MYCFPRIPLRYIQVTALLNLSKLALQHRPMKSINICALARLLFCYACTLYCLTVNAENQSDQNTIAAPGYGSLAFIAAQVGRYQLPVLGVAADGQVLDSQANSLRLHDLMGNKIVLLSFIYATCNDVNGCPLATTVFHRIKSRLKQEPELAKQLRLLTLSFDPRHDTPEQMRRYGESFQDQGVEWKFLTTESESTLKPILEAYQQSIQKQYNQQGQDTGTYAHILRVFLIDKNKRLRNIYSVSFLHPDTLINDIKTLLLADGLDQELPKINLNAKTISYQQGDNKSGYEQTDYVTQSSALSHRMGQSTELITLVTQPPLGLPAVPSPKNNKITQAKISLGRKLFYDRRLSLNNTFSCAMCHIPEQGFSSNEMVTAVGIEGRSVKRNTPTLYNVAYMSKLFHDGREDSLEQQVWGPLLASNEMANPAIASVINKLKNSRDYDHLFEQAFNKAPSMETVGMALASYQRTLNSANSDFDQWYYGKQNQTLSKMSIQGYNLFVGKAACVNCHTINSNYALFTDNKLHNTGLGYQQSMAKQTAAQRVQVAPGLFIDVDSSLIDSVSATQSSDLGLYEITQNPDDRWKYKTPSLRNIALTAPYMHNGEFATLQQVVEFYNQGGIANENLDKLIKPLNLSDVEIKALVDFLKSLTGDNINTLVSDAYAAPIGDP